MKPELILLAVALGAGSFVSLHAAEEDKLIVDAPIIEGNSTSKDLLEEYSKQKITIERHASGNLSIESKNLPWRDYISILAALSGEHVVIDSVPEDIPLVMKLTDVPVSVLFKWMLQMPYLEVTRKDGVVHVAANPDNKLLDRKALFEKHVRKLNGQK